VDQPTSYRSRPPGQPPDRAGAVPAPSGCCR